MLTYMYDKNDNCLGMRMYKGKLELKMYKNHSARMANDDTAMISLTDADLNNIIYHGREVRNVLFDGCMNDIRKEMCITYNKDADMIEIHADKQHGCVHHDVVFTVNGAKFVSTIYNEVMC